MPEIKSSVCIDFPVEFEVVAHKVISGDDIRFYAGDILKLSRNYQPGNDSAGQRLNYRLYDFVRDYSPLAVTGNPMFHRGSTFLTLEEINALTVKPVVESA